ncbi:hypothetical protein [Phycicoccus sp. Soil803]|uniref:hypothetical protein n=1 Tax=Phycicoccus sp. Soil803 TaxID=1736415 RepID=UPI00070F5B2C|nr:hypothetical protein [Phycicoccus sp. Soil803]KRF23778.1 hypothetical protein ASG95_03645 [Phycicoccus sp. Soil803]
MGRFLVDLGVLALVPLLSAGLGLVLKRLSSQHWAEDDLSLAVELTVACLVLHGTFLSRDLAWLLSHEVAGDSSVGDLLNDTHLHVVLLVWRLVIGAVLLLMAIVAVYALRDYDRRLGGVPISSAAAVTQTAWASGALMGFFLINYLLESAVVS